jgi:hypothetical protein
VRIFPARELGPTAWYRASEGVTSVATAVSQWNDISGNAHHLTQATGSKQPLVLPALINGYPAVRFDGVDDFMATANFTLNQPETIFIVYKQITLTGFGTHDVILDGKTAQRSLSTDTDDTITLINAGTGMGPGVSTYVANGVYAYATLVFNGASSKIRANGVQIASGNAGTNNGGGLTLGALAGGTRSCNIEVAELIDYAGVLAANQITDVEAYLKTTYGL